jgi:ribose transport system substrate-binding protein
MRRTRTVAALIATAALLAACGSSSSSNTSSSSSSSSSSSGSMSKYQARLDALYKGTYTAPPGPKVKAPSGKKVWFVSFGQGIDTSVNAYNAVKAAGAKLGWNIQLYDAKFDPNRMLQGVQQAIAAKADGIITAYIDCPTVKNGLQQAKNAGIPSVGIEAKDCSPSLFSHVVTYAQNMPFRQWIQGWGAAQAAWVIAKTNGQAKTILNTETDTETTRLQTAGIKSEFAKCTLCQILGDAQFTGADLGPKLQAKIQQQFIKHPDANSFIPSYDAPMTQYGGAQALKATGRLSQLKVAGGEGSKAGIDQIRSGNGMQSCSGLPTAEEGYGAVDSLIRLMLKRDPNESNSGIGWQVCDKTHNLPPAGKGFQPPLDYASAFYKLWGVQ